MTYSKPEVAVLGEAARVIQSNQKVLTPFEPGSTTKHVANPAYDPDE